MVMHAAAFTDRCVRLLITELQRDAFEELKEFNKQFSELIPLSVLKQVWAFWGSAGRYSTLLSIYSFTCLIASGLKSSKGSVAT